MIVYYRVWLKDREDNRSRMQFVVCEFDVDDLIERAHDLLLKQTDFEFICYRVDLLEIADFVL